MTRFTKDDVSLTSGDVKDILSGGPAFMDLRFVDQIPSLEIEKNSPSAVAASDHELE
jgi:hypothetical protein